jgi:hypothetical protein
VTCGSSLDGVRVRTFRALAASFDHLVGALKQQCRAEDEAGGDGDVSHRK